MSKFLKGIIAFIFCFGFLEAVSPFINDLADLNPLQRMAFIHQSDVTIHKCQIDNGIQVWIVHDPKLQETGIGLHWGHDPIMDRISSSCIKAASILTLKGSSPLLDGASLESYLLQQKGTIESEIFPDGTCYYITCTNDESIRILSALGQKFLHLLQGIKIEDQEINILKRNPYSHGEDYPEMLAESDTFRRKEGLHRLLGDLHPLRFVSSGLVQVENVTSIKKWLHAQYAPQDCSLILFSPQNVDLLQKEIGAAFSTIPRSETFERTKKIPQRLSEPRAFFIPSVEGSKTLTLAWELNEKNCPFALQDAYEIVLFLQRKSSESLYNILRNRGLAYDLEVEWLSMKQIPDILVLTVHLSQEGILNWQSVIQEIFNVLESHLTQDSQITQLLLRESRLVEIFHQSIPHYEKLDFWLRRCTKQIRLEQIDTFPYHSTICLNGILQSQKAYEDLKKAPLRVLLCASSKSWKKGKPPEASDCLLGEKLPIYPMKIDLSYTKKEPSPNLIFEKNIFIPDELTPVATTINNALISSEDLNSKNISNILFYKLPPCAKREVFCSVVQTPYHNIEIAHLKNRAILGLYEMFLHRQFADLEKQAAFALCEFNIEAFPRHLLITCSYWQQQGYDIFSKIMNSLATTQITLQEFQILLEERISELNSIELQVRLRKPTLDQIIENMLNTWSLKDVIRETEAMTYEEVVSAFNEIRTYLSVKNTFLSNKSEEEMKLYLDIERYLFRSDILSERKLSVNLDKFPTTFFQKKSKVASLNVWIPFGREGFSGDYISSSVYCFFLNVESKKWQTSSIWMSHPYLFRLWGRNFLSFSLDSTIHSKALLEEEARKIFSSLNQKLFAEEFTEASFNKSKKIFEKEFSCPLSYFPDKWLYQITHFLLIKDRPTMKERINKDIESFSKDDFLHKICQFTKQSVS